MKQRKETENIHTQKTAMPTTLVNTGVTDMMKLLKLSEKSQRVLSGGAAISGGVHAAGRRGRVREGKGREGEQSKTNWQETAMPGALVILGVKGGMKLLKLSNKKKKTVHTKESEDSEARGSQLGHAGKLQRS